MDRPGPPHFYGIHHLVQCGIKYSKLPGEWFGPSTAAHVLRDLSEIHRSKYGGSLAVYVSDGNTVYFGDINRHLCEKQRLARLAQQNQPVESLEEGEFFDPLLNVPPSAKEPAGWDEGHALLLLLPLRLGLSRLQPVYLQGIREILRHDKCVGILGGKVNHALYFAGYEGSSLLGLDPHTTFPAPAEEFFPTEEYLEQIHVDEMDRVDIHRLDPSLTLGFYFRAKDEFDEWVEEVKRLNETKDDSLGDEGDIPLFYVAREEPRHYEFTQPPSFESEGLDSDDSDSAGSSDPENDDEDGEYVVIPDFK